MALDSELKQEVTDEKLRTNKFLGDGEPGSGNDFGELPVSHPSEIVIPETGQVADVTETVSADEQHLVEGPPLHAGSSEQVGDVWVQKKVETRSTFDDKIFQLTREDLIPPEFRALVPEKLEAHTVNGAAALPTLGAGETVRREQQQKVGIKTVSVQSRDMTTPPVITGEKIDPQWNGATLNVEQRIVPVATNISQGFGTTDINSKPIDGTSELQTKEYCPGGFPTIIVRKFDAEVQTEVYTTQSVVQQGSPYTATSLDLDYEERVIDAVHSLRRTDRVSSMPGAFNTYTTSMFTFPGILTGLSFALVQLAAANRKEPQWTAGVRASFSAPTTLRNQVDFFPYTTVPSTLLPGLYTWAQTDIVFKGISYSLNIQNVLTDTWTNIGVTYAGDTYYGATTDRFSISATSPSATAYVAAIGVEVPISCVVEQYKRFWVRKISLVVLR